MRDDGPDPPSLPRAAAPVSLTDRLQQLNAGTAFVVATTARPVVPMPTVQTEPLVLSTPVANAEAVIRRELYPRARRCYQRALDIDSTQAGKVLLTLRVGASGEVASVGAESRGGLSRAVSCCVAGAAQGLRFAPPGPSGSTLSVGVDFLPGG